MDKKIAKIRAKLDILEQELRMVAEKGVPVSKPKKLATRRTNCEFCKHCICVKENTAGIVIECKKLETKILCKDDNFICCKFKPSKIGKQKIKERKRNEK